MAAVGAGRHHHRDMRNLLALLSAVSFLCLLVRTAPIDSIRRGIEIARASHAGVAICPQYDIHISNILWHLILTLSNPMSPQVRHQASIECGSWPLMEKSWEHRAKFYTCQSTFNSMDYRSIYETSLLHLGEHRVEGPLFDHNRPLDNADKMILELKIYTHPSEDDELKCMSCFPLPGVSIEGKFCYFGCLLMRTHLKGCGRR